MSRRIVALVSGSGWHVEDLRRAAARRGDRLEAAPFATLVARVVDGSSRVMAGVLDLGGVDGLLVRMMPPGTLEQVVYRMDVLQLLEAAGVRVLNSPRAIEAAVDKYLALGRLAAAGVPVPRTWVGESARDALDAYDELEGDVVVKPLFGSEGRGLSRVTDREAAWRIFHALERVGSVLYLQRTVDHPGHDLRAFVLDGRVIGAIRRFARPGEWRTNVAVGGRAEAIELDPAAESLALRAARAVGAAMAGVDLLPDPGEPGGLVVPEVNAVPGWRALSAATGVDVAAAILGSFGDR